MVDDLVLPAITSTLWILATFLIALAAFHLLLVRWMPLDKLAWKKVDYVWLPLALLGVIGGVGSVRQEIASGMASTAESRLQFAAREIEDRLAFGRGPAICRTFVRSEYSPPPEEFDRIQRAFDEECKWFRAASERLQGTPFSKQEILRLEDFGTPPSGGDKWAASSLQDALRRYNETVTKAKELSDAKRRSEIEFLLAIVGPFLLAIALALRITKVTGEIKLETRPHSAA